jgi:hypothetical protein
MLDRPAEDPGRYEDRRWIGRGQRAPEFVEFDRCPLPESTGAMSIDASAW